MNSSRFVLGESGASFDGRMMERTAVPGIWRREAFSIEDPHLEELYRALVDFTLRANASPVHRTLINFTGVGKSSVVCRPQCRSSDVGRGELGTSVSLLLQLRKFLMPRASVRVSRRGRRFENS